VIFVSVGTHEQPFDRLLREVDRLAGEGVLRSVFCQTGYSEYTPEHAEHAAMVGFAEMQQRLQGSQVVVSHGGPGTIAPVLAAGRPLVLVPRQHRFGEHVDDHQVAFCRRLGRERGLLVVEDITDLDTAIATAAQRQPGLDTAQRRPEAAVLELGRRIEALTARRT